MWLICLSAIVAAIIAYFISGSHIKSILNSGQGMYSHLWQTFAAIYLGPGYADLGASLLRKFVIYLVLMIVTALLYMLSHTAGEVIYWLCLAFLVFLSVGSSLLVSKVKKETSESGGPEDVNAVMVKLCRIPARFQFILMFLFVIASRVIARW